MSDLLRSLKSLLIRCSLWDMVTAVDKLRLDTTIRMLNIAHFNAKMNALKEVGTMGRTLDSVSSPLPPPTLPVGREADGGAIPGSNQGREEPHFWREGHGVAAQQ